MDFGYDYLFKIILLGDSGVGKTSLVRRSSQDDFSPHLKPTIGVDFTIKTIDTRGKSVKVWDTAGAERFSTITQSYYRNAHAIIIVYDVTDRSSFENIAFWLGEVERYCENDITKALVGNKSDCRLDRKVTYEEGQTTANTKSMLFLETSAKTASNVEEMFDEVGKRLCCKAQQGNMTTANYLIRKSPTNCSVILKPGTKEATGCCRV